MNAKEMFEKLGYEKINVGGHIEIAYKKINSDGDVEEIMFNDGKTFCAFCNSKFSYIKLEELQAINKQIEELHWEE